MSEDEEKEEQKRFCKKIVVAFLAGFACYVAVLLFVSVVVLAVTWLHYLSASVIVFVLFALTKVFLMSHA